MSPLLLVEDDRECAAFFRVVLSQEFDVTVAFNMTEALALLEERTFDAVIADWSLPDGLGTAVLERARERRTFGVLVTGFQEAEIATRGRFTILFKPVANDKLLCWARDAAARTALARACA